MALFSSHGAVVAVAEAAVVVVTGAATVTRADLAVAEVVAGRTTALGTSSRETVMTIFQETSLNPSK